MGKNEEKMKALTGDPNFGSTVKNAFVKSAALQAQNQTMLAQNTTKNAKNVAQNYGDANASYGRAYEQHTRNVGGFAKSTADHWADVNAHNSKLQQQNGLEMKRDEIDHLTEEYMNKKKLPEKRARYKATRKLLEQEGQW